MDSDNVERGAVIESNGEKHVFQSFIDATGQQAVSAWDVPFPRLIEQGVVCEALTVKSSTIEAANTDTAVVATGGIDLDEFFRPKFERNLSHNLYCVSIPFLLHKLPCVQGITSAADLA